MRRITIIGTGYVGLVTGACLAQLGNSVVCLDVEAAHVDSLDKGIVPFFEPGLQELVVRNQHSERLRFSNKPQQALAGSEIVFITVSAMVGEDGRTDLSQVRAAAHEIAAHLDRDKIVVNKSTVPVETATLVTRIIREHKRADHSVAVVSNPEFLSEGSAIEDFMHPDRIVIGSSDAEAVETMKQLYAPLDAPFIVTDVRTAETIKYAANAFLAAKISFVNEIASICEAVGADVTDVARGVGMDRRIGTAFLNAGLGFGGSCLPKDVVSLQHIARSAGVTPTMLAATAAVNHGQVARSVEKVRALAGELKGARLGVLGLAFKPGTDDVRDSPAIALVRALLAEGARISAHDPAAIANARRLCGEAIGYVESPYEAAQDADAVIVATDWNEYKQIDLALLKKAMRHPRIFDARNIFDPATIRNAGFAYAGIGRKAAAA